MCHTQQLPVGTRHEGYHSQDLEIHSVGPLSQKVVQLGLNAIQLCRADMGIRQIILINVTSRNKTTADVMTGGSVVQSVSKAMWPQESDRSFVAQISSPSKSIASQSRPTEQTGLVESSCGSSRPFQIRRKWWQMSRKTCPCRCAYAWRPSSRCGQVVREEMVTVPPFRNQPSDFHFKNTRTRLISSLSRDTSSAQRSLRARAFDHSSRNSNGGTSVDIAQKKREHSTFAELSLGVYVRGIDILGVDIQGVRVWDIYVRGI